MDFTLNDEQTAIRDTALDFARARIAPHALEWDEAKHFPIDVLREAAALGMAGIYTREADRIRLAKEAMSKMGES